MSQTGPWVAYYRVSTSRQKKSGLGLEAQRAAVLAYLNGGEPKASFTEVESGGNTDRPELAKALAACRRFGARLIVSKLDRLSRDARFLMDLKAKGVKFVIADMPEANDLTVDLFAILAQHERRVISERTKAALAAAKQRGAKLGGAARDRNFSRAESRRGAANSAQVRQQNADQFARDLAPSIDELRASGLSSLREIARGLNEREEKTRRGGPWSARQVQYLLDRIDALKQEP